MGKTTGFLEYDRVDGPVRGEQQRTQDFREFHSQLPLPAQQEQAGRCMDCGVPFCQSSSPGRTGRIRSSGNLSGQRLKTGYCSRTDGAPDNNI